ncbi:MAG: pentapeptide repeat-containing protein [Mycobacterium sp.]|uniref:pentapeptide repeat-containing protein n=1 Tax=Mycobacterium sp. TaxID=1785 RepID=UPI001EB29282|nr:pentapeptide repeat-containing protein [Mycobacterium sp.]MBV8785755.1 pentapeptide repeat-containing protein [Mycobacterium sp.]
MTAPADATPTHDVLPMAQTVPSLDTAFPKLRQPGGRHSHSSEQRGRIDGKKPTLREPSANASITRLRQTVTRQQRLRLPQPVRPVIRSRWRRLLEKVKRDFVALFNRVDWSKVTAFATALAAVVAIFFSARSLGSTENQYSLSARGQLSDRFNKAIGQLDSSKNAIDVVVGGIYSLEQLTQDPLADGNLRLVVMNVLDTYVADHPPKECTKVTPPSADVQAALTVIGRRKSQEQIDLSAVCLNGADLRGAQLEGAWLKSTTLNQATLSGANLASADLTDAILKNAYLGQSDKWGRTNLKGAILINAHLNYANLTGANLTHANLTGATLTGANFAGAKLTNANLTNICYETSVRWPDGFTAPPSSSPKCETL